MALENILQRLDKETESEIKAIEAEAEREAEKTLSQAAGEAEKIRKTISAEGERKIESERKRRLALKRLELNNEILKLKHEIINRIFEEAFDKVGSLPDEEYKALIKKLFFDCAEPGRGTLHISESDRDRINAEFLSEIIRELGQKGTECDCLISPEAAPIKGGFILKTGNITINCTLDAVFDRAREEFEKSAGEILFNERR